LRKRKSTLRSNRYKAYIIKISNYFINKDYSRGWHGLKKISKPAYLASTLHLVKSKSGQDLFDPNDLRLSIQKLCLGVVLNKGCDGIKMIIFKQIKNKILPIMNKNK